MFYPLSKFKSVVYMFRKGITSQLGSLCFLIHDVVFQMSDVKERLLKKISYLVRKLCILLCVKSNNLVEGHV